MAVVSEEDAILMSDRQKRDYCNWCYSKGYGTCRICALERKDSPQVSTGDKCKGCQHYTDGFCAYKGCIR
jgi:hypothetical protein